MSSFDIVLSSFIFHNTAFNNSSRSSTSFAEKLLKYCKPEKAKDMTNKTLRVVIIVLYLLLLFIFLILSIYFTKIELIYNIDSTVYGILYHKGGIQGMRNFLSRLTFGVLVLLTVGLIFGLDPISISAEVTGINDSNSQQVYTNDELMKMSEEELEKLGLKEIDR